MDPNLIRSIVDSLKTLGIELVDDVNDLPGLARSLQEMADAYDYADGVMKKHTQTAGMAPVMMSHIQQSKGKVASGIREAAEFLTKGLPPKKAAVTPRARS